MKINLFLMSAVVAMAVLLHPALAAAEGWGLPSLNPFGSKEKKPASSLPTFDDDAAGGSWSVPKRKTPSNFASSRTTEPSTWQKMSSGTSSAVKKTTSALNPWKKSKPVTRVTGLKPKPVSKSTWYNPTTWFSSQEKQSSRSAGVPGFIGQPRVPVN